MYAYVHEVHRVYEVVVKTGHLLIRRWEIKMKFRITRDDSLTYSSIYS